MPDLPVAILVSTLGFLAAIVFGAKPLSEKVSRTAFFLYILFLQLASAHHLLADPGVSSNWKIFNTSYAMYLAVLASMVHGLTVPGAIEVAQREKGYNKGLFEWLRKAPWGNPVFSGIFMSLVGFGFLGGRWSAPSADTAAWRTELKQLAATLETQRTEDRRAVTDILMTMQSQHSEDYAALRRALETLAVNTEDSLQTAQQQIVQLATTGSSGPR